MKFTVRNLSKLSVLTIIAFNLNACGAAQDFLANKGSSGDKSAVDSGTESDSQNLMDSTYASASGMSDPQFRPFRVGPDTGQGPDEDRGPEDAQGHGEHHGGRHGHHKGPHGQRGSGHAPPALPADIAELMKSADAKKDSVLGIDRTKVDAILKSMQTDLEVLRSVAGSREVFLAKAKEIQNKYSEQLKAALPAFDSLNQEQKDRVKAIHDLQKKVIDSCVARGADAASATCTSAKSDLKANVDAP